MTVSAKREVKVELKSSAAGMDDGIRDARRKLNQLERDQARAAKQAERDAKATRKAVLGSGRSILGGVAQGVQLGLGIQAAGGLANMASEVFDYEKALTRLQITANAAPASMRDFSNSVNDASRNTGLSRNEILSAASAYVALTGDMDTARASTGTWAKIAQATGSTVSDIAQTAAALSQQMGIGPAQMEETFSALAQQGKAGAIELKDLAGVMSQIAPMWGLFKGGKGVDGVRELGAALQIVKRGFGGDAGETVTGLQGLLVSLQKNAGRFKAHGIKIFDVDKNGKETMRGVFDIVDAISKSDLVKHPDVMEKAFGRVEAYRAYLQLVQNRDVLHKFVDESRDAGLIQRDFDTYMESSSAKLDKSWNAVKLAVAETFTPERIAKFAEAVSGLADKLGPVVDLVGKIADGMGALYGAGKSIRSFLTPDDSRLASTTPEEAQLEAKAKGISESEAYRSLQAQHGRYLAAKRSISEAMANDKTTPESNKRAVAALISTEDNTGEGARRAGAQYLAEAHLSSDEVANLASQIRGENLDAAIADGRGRTEKQPDMGDFINAMKAVQKEGAQEIGRSVAQALASSRQNVKIGSETLVKATRNAPILNTRPGGP